MSRKSGDGRASLGKGAESVPDMVTPTPGMGTGPKRNAGVEY